MASITLRDVRKSFGRAQVVRGLDLDIRDREFVVFVGPSGCGKSTLLRLIAGLEDPSGGEILFDDDVVNEWAPAERGVAMVFQSYALYPHMNVFDNMAFGLKLAGAGRASVAERVHEAARILQLEELLHRKPRQLSGGQRQRVAIGRAIVRKPRVFLFDEPLSNLDAALRVRMRVEIAALHRRLDATMVYVTHDQVEAMTLADRIVVLNDGAVEQVGAPLELYERPRNLFVAGFIGSPRMNFVEGRITECRPDEVVVAVGSNAVSLPVEAGNARVGQAVTLGVRPEHLAPDAVAGVRFSGEIVAVERLGGETHLFVDCGTREPMLLKSAGDLASRVGERIVVGAPTAVCQLFDQHGLAFGRHPSRSQLAANGRPELRWKETRRPKAAAVLSPFGRGKVVQKR